MGGWRLIIVTLLVSNSVSAQTIQQLQAQQKKEHALKQAQVKEAMRACTGQTQHKDVMGRNLSQNIQLEMGDTCVVKKPNIDRFELLNKQIQQSFQIADASTIWKEVNEISLERTAKSVWATYEKLISDKKLTEKTALALICKHVPRLCKNQADLKTIKKAYSSFKAETTKKPIKFLDGEQQNKLVMNELQPLINRANQTCQITKKKYNDIKLAHSCLKLPVFKKGQPYKPVKPMTQVECRGQLDQAYAKHKRLQTIARQSMELDMQLIIGSQLGSLFITENLRKKMGILKPDFTFNECMKGDGSVLNQIWNKDIIEARNDFYALTVKELKKIEEYKTHDFSPSQKKTTLKQYLKTNPGTVAEMLRRYPDKNKAFAVCSLIQKISSQDKVSKIVDGVIIGTGVVASIALGFTGVGAPAGAALAAVVLGSSALSVAKSAIDYSEQIRQDKHLRTAVATKQKNFDDALNELKVSDDRKEMYLDNIKIVAGSEIIGFGVGKGLKLLTQVRQARNLKALAQTKSGLTVLEEATQIKKLEAGAASFKANVTALGKKGAHLNKLTLVQEAELAHLFSQLSPEKATLLTKKISSLKTSDELTAFVTAIQKDEALLKKSGFDIEKLNRLVDRSKKNPPIYLVLEKDAQTSTVYSKLSAADKKIFVKAANDFKKLKLSETEILSKLSAIQKNCLKKGVVKPGCVQTQVTKIKELHELKLVRDQNKLIPSCVDVSQQKLVLQEIGKKVMNSPNYFLKCGLHWMKVDEYHKVLRDFPEQFAKYFGPNSYRQIPDNKNLFAFSYTDVNTVCNNNYGFCRGYTVSLVRWQRLAHYDPDFSFLKGGAKPPLFIAQKKGQSLADFHQANEAFFNYYKPTIDAIQKGEPAIIHGYKDLRHFSENPIIQHYLKENVALAWAKENTNLFSVTSVLPKANSSMTKKSIMDVRDALDLKINKLSYNPIMMVVRPQSKSWVKGDGYYHVMQAFHVTPIQNNRFSIYLQDLDFIEASKNVRRMEIDLSSGSPKIFGDIKFSKKTGGSQNIPNVYYEFGPVSHIEEVPFNDILVGNDLKNLSAFYKENPNFFNTSLKSSPLQKQKALNTLLEESENLRFVRKKGESLFDLKYEDIVIKKMNQTDKGVEVAFSYKGKEKKVLIGMDKIEENNVLIKDGVPFKKFMISDGYVDDLLIYY